jgi:putative radical SAM-modified peptide
MAIEVLNQGVDECQMVAACCSGGTTSTRK